MLSLTKHHQRGLFRLATVLACTASVVLSAPLWQVRSLPPQLPLLPLPSLPVALPLLAALALCVFAPLAGWLTYCAVLAYAILVDQTRLQPEFISFGILLAAGLPGPTGVALARLHLITIWFYAGLHKLLSVDFMQQGDAFLLTGLVADPPLWLRQVFPPAIVASEIGVALFALLPRTRRLAVAGACLLHGGILLALINSGWNRAVWPWNVLCAIAAIALILPWTRPLFGDLRALRWPARLVALAMVVYPLGFYVGLADTYTAHSLYARNEPRGYVCDLDGAAQPDRPGLGDAIEYLHADGTFHCRAIYLIDDLGVPFPPLHRLFEQYFARTCTAREFLLILERRRFFTARGEDQRILYCPPATAANIEQPRP